MPRTYVKKTKLYTEASIANAIEEVLVGGASVRQTAKKYHMSEFMLQFRIKVHKGEKNLKTRGVPTRISSEIETKLANIITRMAESGLGPTKEELGGIISDYLDANELTNLFNNKQPGNDWVMGFLKRNHLSLKKGGQMQIARKNVTSDPFVVYGFYDLLEKHIETLGIADRPECFWNLDESGFPNDPSKCKTVGPIGSKTIRITCGANRENTTVLAVCCANGEALDPLIIFKGKNLQSTWHGSEALPNTTYAVSDSGWMTTSIFHDFFTHFVRITKDIRPLLLLLDGHLSHTSLQTIELATKENISILKLPPHCTDLLQPLDVACFNPLKCHYEALLTKRVHETGAREPLRKSNFTNLICKIWKMGLSEENVKSGFRATGIFPLDPTKYNKQRLDVVKMESYERWRLAGKPLDNEGEPEIPEKQVQVDLDTNIGAGITEYCESPIDELESTIDTASGSNITSSRPGSSKVIVIHNKSFESTTGGDVTNLLGASTGDLIKALQLRAPVGMKYQITLIPKESEITLETVIKSRGRPCTPAPEKRRKVSMKASIITEKAYKESIALPTKRTKVPRQDSSSESDVDDVEEFPLDISQDAIIIGTSSLTKKNIGDHYAVYWSKPLTYYWGKILQVFQDDEESVIKSVEVNFMHRKKTSSNPKNITWNWPRSPDSCIVDVTNLMYGPESPVYIRAGEYHFESEEEAAKQFIKYSS